MIQSNDLILTKSNA